jgi:predicted Zn-dependent protease
MNHRVLRNGLVFLLVTVLIQSPLFSTFAWGRATAEEAQSKEEEKLRKEQAKREEQEKQRKKKESENRTEAGKLYDKLKKFALDLYNSDPDFHDQVDEAYLDLQAQHALQAYQINTTRNSELLYPETEDITLQIRRVLYDNPWVQDYVNSVGQRLVPDDSDKLYAFKVTYHPIPYAYTLSTGTVLVSTGMISLLDNEAQLAYLVSHELAHVYKDHWRLKVMMPLAAQEYNERQQRKRAWFGLLGAAAGAAVGGIVKGGTGAMAGAGIGLLAGYAIGSVLNKKIGVDWDEAQENEADDFALRLVMDKYYDAKEVPQMYVALYRIAQFDERVQLGFLGRLSRIRERKEYTESQLQGPLQGKYQELLKSGKMIGTTAEYNLIMAELKRDNGIEAYRFDMFNMAKRNLEQAVALRSDDARATYYCGRVLKLVGRTPEEHKMAEQYLVDAIRLDTRKTIPEAQLQRALMSMQTKEPAAREQTVRALKDYIMTYQDRKCEDSHCLPPNVDVLYDYLRLLGEKSWEPPAAGVTRVSAPEPEDKPPDAPRSSSDHWRPVKRNQ